MFLRALAAFLILPGVVAGIIPLLLAYSDLWRGHAVIIPGGIIMGLGFFLLLWCVRDFYVSGKGTLAPWDPPKHLVVVGLYRFSRNPMYISVLTLIGGWALLAASPLTGAYFLIFCIIFHLRVIFYEEPCLSKMFGQEWTDYCAQVSRWISIHI
ncbi:MAG: isoprenylcysteine carboxylmethyltransferase family protein [Victivallales bacterium]